MMHLTAPLAIPYSALGLLSLWNKSRVAWRLLITAIARYPLVSLAEGRPG